MNCNTRISLFCFAACITAMLFFAYQYELIIVQPYATSTPSDPSDRTMISYTLFVPSGATFAQETETVVTPDNQTALLFHIVQRWLYYAYHEGHIAKKIVLQSAMLNDEKTHLFISCDRNPLPIQGSTYQRMRLIESLIATIAQQPNIAFVRILVQHAPLEDPYIELTRDIPISRSINT